jgi:tyrosinase
MSFITLIRSRSIADGNRNTLTTKEKTDYINSIKCLQSKPAMTPTEAAPGVRTRYDDFTAVHVNNTVRIHGNGVFFSWHRHFLHLYQKALKEECGFKGTLPYWNWAWSSDNLTANPIFDGSATSFGGDGAQNASKALVMNNGNYIYPRGNGGGCIASGPFANLTVPFRGFTNDELSLPETPVNALDYAPRCVTRDLNSAISSVNMNQSVVDTLLAQPTIKDFETYVDGIIPDTPFLGPHPGVHWAVGWGLEDQYASPSDPVFYLHHGMVDNMWAQWQSKDLENRQYAVYGTNRSLNIPPATNVTIDFEMQFNYLAGPITMRDVSSTQQGEYCYRYDYTEGAPSPF